MTHLRRLISMCLFRTSENVCLMGDALNQRLVSLSGWLDDLARDIAPPYQPEPCELGMDPDRPEGR